MQIVIDIPKTAYDYFTHGLRYTDDVEMAIMAIVDGTPLPKGHGRLVDADETLKAMDTWDKFGYTATGQLEPIRERNMQNDYVPYVHYEDMVQCVANMPTIIEADKGEEDE